MIPERSSLPAEVELTPQCFEKLSVYINRTLGIKMPPQKLSLLQGRLQRRLRKLSITNIDDYISYLFKSPDTSEERLELLNLATTNKTDFFRERIHLDYLTETALPALKRSTCKIWSAGCSSGEEAYSIAMVLSEYQRKHTGFSFSILGTDISTKVLEAAETGIYDESKVQPIPMELRKKYLLKSKDSSKHLVRIIPELRKLPRFKRLNFMDPQYDLPHDIDVVFFRNVMIYFSKETQAMVLKKIYAHMSSGGFLFVGHSESLIGVDTPFIQLAVSIFRKP